MSFATAAAPAEHSKIAAKGYMLKKCRVNGDVKPWKKRFFVLQGGSLIYYRSANMAGAFKLFLHLGPDVKITRANEPPKQAKESIPVAIAHGSASNAKVYQVAFADAAAYDHWIEALETAKGYPPMDLPDQSYKYAGSSATLRLKMGLSAALASSSIGRSIVKAYMDDASRELIKSLIEFAEFTEGSKTSRAFEKGVFDIAARISVIWRAAKFPPDLDLSLLYDETTNFTQDFLMYCRDIRLKDVRGPDAEVEPINMPELMRSSGVVQEMWKEILIPHVSKKVLTTFDSITDFYFNEQNLWAVMKEEKPDPQAKKIYGLMCSIEKSLRTVLERY